MSKISITVMRKKAEENYDKWRNLAFDVRGLEAEGKTQAEAVQLTNYFEGLVDGLTEALRAVQ